ncbi:unnamed protein product [Larinioides sclopetarius]|uniref:Uncharacterized protein n=1 Tax=Larinioides sclopetarius TaxID=280406 RepID=A0AAV2BMI8_9ARAC
MLMLCNFSENNMYLQSDGIYLCFPALPNGIFLHTFQEQSSKYLPSLNESKTAGDYKVTTIEEKNFPCINLIIRILEVQRIHFFTA